MFDEILGLPLHPLVVHAPVVLVPLAAAVAVAYGLLVPLRRYLGWLLVLLSLGAAGGAFVAVLSGEAFEKRLGGSNPEIQRHQGFGDNLRIYALALAAVAVVLVLVDLMRRPRRRADGPGAAVDSGTRGTETPTKRRSGLGIVSLVLTIALLALAAVSTYYVVRVGHSGAEMVWGSR